MTEADEKLRRGLDELEASGRSVNLFFRNDDVDEDIVSLRLLLDLFVRVEVPLNLEIIPGLMTENAVTLLREHQRRRPGLIELNQHGWRHVNHEWHGRKCEFGPSRTFDQQFADLASGARILEDAFGSGFSRVFTPPWNRCTEETIDALKRLNFQAISRLDRLDSKEPEKSDNFPEISVTLDLYRWKGGARMKTPDELTVELIAQLHSLETVGVMLHHKVMDEAAFEWLSALLTKLCGRPFIKFHTFQSLLKQYSGFQLRESGQTPDR